MSRTPEHAGAAAAEPGGAARGSAREIRGEEDGSGLRVAVVVSRFNEEITERLLAGALRGLRRRGVSDADITVVRVPGAWELPTAVRWLVDDGAADAIVALGCVIRGETPHFEYVAGEAARGLAELARDARVPVAFGVLTTETAEQARARSGGAHGDKGDDAAACAIEMARLRTALRSGRPVG